MTALPSSSEVQHCLRVASELSNLAAERRLDAKIDLSAAAIRRRLVAASDLLEACEQLRALGRRIDRV